jgi:hypothetical protein
MAETTFKTRRTALAIALAATGAALIDANAQTTLAPVAVTGKAPIPASVAGWGDTPLEAAPLQATTIDAAQIRDAGARRLSDLTRFDASVTTAYDTEGYIDYFTIRGFVVEAASTSARRPADQRRDIDPAREQGARRHPQGPLRPAGRNERAGRPGGRRRQAPARRAAALGLHRMARARQRARLDRPQPALRRQRRVRRSPQRRRRAHRPDRPQREGQPQHDRARRRLARERGDAGRGEIETATSRSRASRLSLLGPNVPPV